MQRGGSSVDTWVLGETNTAASDTAPRGAAPAAGPDGFETRPAPHDGQARDVNAVDGEPLAPLAEQSPVTSSRAAENLFWLGRYLERIMDRLRQQPAAAGPANTDALAPAFASMRQAASAVRERLSPTQWQGIQQAHDLPALEALASALAARQNEGSHEDEGWRLFVTGQAIERMASQPDSADLAWRLTEDLSARLFTHSDDARQRVGA